MTIGPDPDDISGRYDYHLDFPGDALNPGASTRSGVAAEHGRRPARLRARRLGVATPGKLALQYWFFYVYNDWNNRTRATGR